MKTNKRSPKFSRTIEKFDRNNILFYYHNNKYKIVVYKLGVDVLIDLWDRHMDGQLYGFVTINKLELLESIDDIYNKIKGNICMKRSYRRFILSRIEELSKIYIK